MKRIFFSLFAGILAVMFSVFPSQVANAAADGGGGSNFDIIYCEVTWQGGTYVTYECDNTGTSCQSAACHCSTYGAWD